MAHQVTKKDLLYLYRRLLRACETYPSTNRGRIYQSIREDFRENKELDAEAPATLKQIHIAYRGLGQLHQFDGRQDVNFSVQLEQNPFPKPDNYDNTRTKRAEEMMEKFEKENE
jgi:Complex 1 protein (LYR family)